MFSKLCRILLEVIDDGSPVLAVIRGHESDSMKHAIDERPELFWRLHETSLYSGHIYLKKQDVTVRRFYANWISEHFSILDTDSGVEICIPLSGLEQRVLDDYLYKLEANVDKQRARRKEAEQLANRKSFLDRIA